MNHLARLAPGDESTRLALSVLAQITGVVLVSALAARVWLRRRAAARHGVWLGALFWVLLSPAAAIVADRAGIALWTWGPSIPAEGPSAATARLELSPAEAIPPPTPIDVLVPEPVVADDLIAESETAARPVADDTPPVSTEVGVREAPTSAPAAARWQPGTFLGAVVAVYASGVAIGLARIAAGLWWVAVRFRTARPLDPVRYADVLDGVRAAFGVETLPPVVTSRDVCGPIAAGLFRPKVVLPEALPGALTGHALRGVLIHECAHVVRRDPWVGLLQRLVAALYWPHPLVHYLNAQLARAREEVCDNHVLGGVDPCGYARTLLDLTELCHPYGPARAGLGLLNVRWTLADRVAGLLDPGRIAMTRTNVRTRIAVAAALAATGFTLAGLRPDRPTRADDAPVENAPAAVTAPDEPDGSARNISGVVVDEQGRPVAGATVRSAITRPDHPTAVTAADGSFRLALRGADSLHNGFVAESDGGTRLGLAWLDGPQNSRPADPLRIVLTPGRTWTVRVRDAAGAAVPGAAVEAIDDDGSSIPGTTGPDGVATLHTPADGKVRTVIGLKRGVGFDGFANDPDGPAPAEVTLTLDGARTARVTAVDSSNKPVPGVVVQPWYIGKADKHNHANTNWDSANTSNSSITGVTTDARGVAVFDWLPKRVEPGIPFLVLPGAYSCPESPLYDPPGPTELTARLLRGTTLRGAVRFPDGRPAANVLIQAEGRGATNLYAHLSTRTGRDGAYAIDVYPEQSYILSVVDENWAARAWTGVVVREGVSQAGLDFTLSKGTLLHGRVAEGPTGNPVVGQSVALIQDGGPLPRDLVSPRGEGDTESLFRSVRTDAEGRYRFRVGPGTYRLRGTNFGPFVPVTVATLKEAEIVRDFTQAPRAESRPLSGVVVVETPSGRKPVAGALVEGARNGLSAKFRAAADAQGRFRGTVPPGPLVVYARSADGKLAGFTPVSETTKEATAFVAEASTVRGRVVDAAGKPLEGWRVRVLLNNGAEDHALDGVARHVRTDADGRFEVAGAVVGTRVEVQTSRTPDEWFHGPFITKTVDVPGPGPVELPDLVIPADEPAATVTKAADVGDANRGRPSPVPVGPSRAEIEALLHAIGRDPVTPESVDGVALRFHPLFSRTEDFPKIRRRATDPAFVRRADAVATEALGRPADSIALIDLAALCDAGTDDASLIHFTRTQARERGGRPRTVTGTVDDAETGRRLAGARVFTRDAITRTDAEGRFTLHAGTGPGAATRYWVEADGYAFREVEGGTDEPTIRLVREVPFDGQALDPDGRPVAGAVVQAQVPRTALAGTASTHPRGDGLARIFMARTDHQGRFSIRGVPPSEGPVSVYLSHPLYRTGFAERAARVAPDRPMVVRLKPGCVVSGVVVDERGRPVAGAWVEIRRPPSMSAEQSAETDAQGRFEFRNVGPGRLDVVVEAERHAAAFARIVADPDRPVENQFVVGGGAYVRGEVVDAEGRPAAGVAVGTDGAVGDAFPALGRMTVSADDGTFRLGPLPPGEWRIMGMTESPRRLGKTIARGGQNDAVIRLESETAPR